MIVAIIALVLQVISWIGIYYTLKSVKELKKKITELNSLETNALQPSKPKRKIFVPKEPRPPLTKEELEKLAQEAQRYREEMSKHLDKLDQIPPEVWKMKVK